MARTTAGIGNRLAGALLLTIITAGCDAFSPRADRSGIPTEVTPNPAFPSPAIRPPSTVGVATTPISSIIPTPTDIAPAEPLFDAACGDGSIDDEFDLQECDDANTIDGDGCSATCKVEAGFDCGAFGCEPICGDGRRVAEELDEGRCDDANATDSDGCQGCFVQWGYSCPLEGVACTSNVVCGDGLWQSGEDCDVALPAHVAHCTAACTAELGFTCNTQTCSAVCGDAQIAGDEACDDGNRNAGDGCDALCRVELDCAAEGGQLDASAPNAQPNDASADAGVQGSNACHGVCGDGIVTLDEVCDEGPLNADGYGTCAANCSAFPRCGDGQVDPGEDCDNGANNDVYSFAPEQCAAACQYPAFCGDGVLNSDWAEECDLGADNSDAYGGCTLRCELGPRCGDGVLFALVNPAGFPYEQCDDGNSKNHDGCSARCERERGYVQ